MKRIGAKRIGALFALCLVALAAPAGARVLGDAQVSYTADRILTVAGQTYAGTLYAMPGFQRHEQAEGGIQQVAILDLKTGRGYFVLPALQSYVEFRIQGALAELSAPDITGDELGREPVNGVATTKYRVAHTAADGTRIEGFAWLGGTGIAMRGQGTVIETNGKRTPFSWELSHVRIGRQDPALFAAPDGFYRLPINALPPFLGGGAG